MWSQHIIFWSNDFLRHIIKTSITSYRDMQNKFPFDWTQNNSESKSVNKLRYSRHLRLGGSQVGHQPQKLQPSPHAEMDVNIWRHWSIKRIRGKKLMVKWFKESNDGSEACFRFLLRKMKRMRRQSPCSLSRMDLLKINLFSECLRPSVISQ